ERHAGGVGGGELLGLLVVLADQVLLALLQRRLRHLHAGALRGVEPVVGERARQQWRPAVLGVAAVGGLRAADAVDARGERAAGGGGGGHVRRGRSRRLAPAPVVVLRRDQPLQRALHVGFGAARVVRGMLVQRRAAPAGRGRHRLGGERVGGNGRRQGSQGQ